MPTREQVRDAAGAANDYQAAGRQLGIPPGQAYLIATGLPADGSTSPSDAQRRDSGVLRSSQHLANPPQENPTRSQVVRDWIAARVAADPQMRAAAARRASTEQSS